jgi:PAS domain S-box-containing protein
MPEKGAMARLRLAEALPAIPLACECRRVRGEAERGLFVAAVNPLGEAPSLPALASFYSAEQIAAAILDEGGRVMAGEAVEDSPPADASTSSIAFAGAGGELRLVLAEKQRGGDAERPDNVVAPEDGGAPAHAVGTEPQRDVTQSGAVPPIVERPARLQPDGASPPSPRVIPIDRFSRPAAPQAASGRSVPKPNDAEPLHEPDIAERSAPPARVPGGAAADTGRTGAETDALPTEVPGESAPAQNSAPTIADRPRVAGPEEARSAESPITRPTRSVMAGRVPRELGRKPIRFLWQTDAADRLLFVSPGLAQVVGRNAEVIGERFQDLAARLRLDPTNRIAHALVQRDTWSGQTAWWPIEGSNVRVPTELTGLPVFGSDHSFQGYRGFGVLKPAEALMPATFEARFGPASPAASAAEQVPPYEEAVATVPANVVPIRADLERLADQHARLSPEERNAFEEIANALRQRVEANGTTDPGRRIEAAEIAEAGRHERAAADAEPPTEPDAVVSPAADAERTPPRSDSAPPPDSEPLGPEAEPPAPEAGGPPPEAGPARNEEAETAPPTAPPMPRPVPRVGERLSEADAHRRLQELTAILDTATDGVVILDARGEIESVSAGAAALFGLEQQELQGTNFADLLTPESRMLALDYLSGLEANGLASLLNEGREVEASAGTGSIPIFMTVGRISSSGGRRFCAVLRDITHWKRTEAELVAARRTAETASTQKSEFLARVSHEIRTPLNAIIGFSEVMIEERFGPVENERYREYLRDIRTSGEHVVSLINDLLDISKIEAGRLDLSFAAVPLNDLVRECMGLMQPQANRAHVVLRSSLSKEVPAIVADQRTLRQIVLNLLSNSVKFTAPGGQVIASTSLAETGEAILRVRDTGEGMSEEELARALEPFRQIATTTLADRTGTGLGLPLTKALVEANRASLSIRSARGEGTVVTITFPATRVLSE